MAGRFKEKGLRLKVKGKRYRNKVMEQRRTAEGTGIKRIDRIPHFSFPDSWLPSFCLLISALCHLFSDTQTSEH